VGYSPGTVSACIFVAVAKQHAVADIFAAAPVCLFAEWFAFLEKIIEMSEREYEKNASICR
jgi:hypothetical protein